MISLSPLSAHQASPAEFLAFIVAYMELLLARWEYIDRGRRPGLKAVTLARFHELGVKDDILLWMLFHDHVEHLRLVPRQKKKLNRRKQRKQRGVLSSFSLLSPVQIQPAQIQASANRSQKKNSNRSKQRKQREVVSPFSPLPPVEIQPGRCKHAQSLTLTDQSCFALNDKGAVFADAFLADVLLPQFEGAFEGAWSHLIMGLLVPAYNHDERVFTWGEHVLKRFRQPAVNQELVLISAEELEWPEWFDDPLLRKNGHNPKTVLHDTIKDLNRHQAEWIVHFKGDGSGRRIGWELK